MQMWAKLQVLWLGYLWPKLFKQIYIVHRANKILENSLLTNLCRLYVDNCKILQRDLHKHY
jgi:hypothetical protein